MIERIGMKVVAFSLIELMVVVAIVAILSAVAVPSYKSYVESARIAATLPFISGQIENAKAYYGVHGTFPNIQQLGFDTTGGSDTNTVAQTDANSYIAPYVASAFAVPLNIGCPGGVVGMQVSNFDGQPSDFSTSGKVVDVNYYLIDINNTIETKCFSYGIDYAAQATFDAKIPGCPDQTIYADVFQSFLDDINTRCP